VDNKTKGEKQKHPHVRRVWKSDDKRTCGEGRRAARETDRGIAIYDFRWVLISGLSVLACVRRIWKNSPDEVSEILNAIERRRINRSPVTGRDILKQR
jgi:hypothetical protein